MRKIVVVSMVLFSVVALAAGVGLAVGQNASEGANETAASSSGTQISENVVVTSASLREGTAYVDIRSDVRQRLDVGTLSVEPGPVPESDTYVLTADETRTIEVPTETVDGYALVMLRPGESNGYIYRLSEPSDFLPGEPAGIDAVIGGVTVFALFGIWLPGSWWLLGRGSGGAHREW